MASPADPENIITLDEANTAPFPADSSSAGAAGPIDRLLPRKILYVLVAIFALLCVVSPFVSRGSVPWNYFRMLVTARIICQYLSAFGILVISAFSIGRNPDMVKAISEAIKIHLRNFSALSANDLLNAVSGVIKTANENPLLCRLLGCMAGALMIGSAELITINLFKGGGILHCLNTAAVLSSLLPLSSLAAMALGRRLQPLSSRRQNIQLQNEKPLARRINQNTLEKLLLH